MDLTIHHPTLVTVTTCLPTHPPTGGLTTFSFQLPASDIWYNPISHNSQFIIHFTLYSTLKTDAARSKGACRSHATVHNSSSIIHNSSSHLSLMTFHFSPFTLYPFTFTLSPFTFHLLPFAFHTLSIYCKQKGAAVFNCTLFLSI